MINSKIENKAIHTVAVTFSDFGWFFNLRSISDFGIDAYVETSLNNRPSGKHFAIHFDLSDTRYFAKC